MTADSATAIAWAVLGALALGLGLSLLIRYARTRDRRFLVFGLLLTAGLGVVLLVYLTTSVAHSPGSSTAEPEPSATAVLHTDPVPGIVYGPPPFTPTPVGLPRLVVSTTTPDVMIDYGPPPEDRP